MTSVIIGIAMVVLVLGVLAFYYVGIPYLLVMLLASFGTDISLLQAVLIWFLLSVVVGLFKPVVKIGSDKS